MAHYVRHALRKTTGITGLRRMTNPEEVLQGLYQRTLEVAKQMPGDAAYRQQLEVVTNSRLETLQASADIEDFEDKINCGQVEQIVIQAEDELKLAEQMLELQPWQPLEEQPLPGQWKFP